MTRTRVLRPLCILAASALGVGAALSAPTRGAAPVTLHVQTRASLVGCLRAAARRFTETDGTAVAFDVLSGPPTDAGVDLIADYSDVLTRSLEGGRADEATATTLGTVARGGARPQAIVAAVAAGATHAAEAARLLDALRLPEARAAFARCAGSGVAATESRAEVGAQADPGGTGQYASAVVDWWVSHCALEGPRKNLSTDPEAVLGAPDAHKLAPDTYSGMMSLGQGGYVTVDLGRSVPNAPGPDFRVFQTTSQEPVTLYASDTASGPYVLVAFRRTCGQPLNHIFSGHCDFDLAEAGLASARYLKIEDGELYPCTAGDTQTEGADIDAVEILAPQ